MKVQYSVRIHASLADIAMTPSARVTRSGVYVPSTAMVERIAAIWVSRKPRLIGAVSEEIARDIIDGGVLVAGRDRWRLSCAPLSTVALICGWDWMPAYGLHCDDIATIGENGDESVVFVTECKGALARNGISRNTEGKMFYQLARTFEKMKKTRTATCSLKLGGVMSVSVSHALERITVNVIDGRSSFAGGLPDAWMYPGRDSDAL